LGVVIAFSYYENARNLTNVSQRFMDRARDDAIDMVSNLLEPVAATIRLVAEVATARVLPRGSLSRPVEAASSAASRSAASKSGTSTSASARPVSREDARRRAQPRAKFTMYDTISEKD
jgi:hypothetical protein